MSASTPADGLPSPDTPAAELPLAAWYADPLEPDQARQLLATLEARHGSGDPFTHELLRVIARWWLGRDIDDDIQRLQQVYAHPGLVRLVHGQLLMSRKLQGAMEQLDTALHELSTQLAPQDYFDLLRRHELLARLHLSARPSPARSLRTLLSEAAAIAALEGPKRPPTGPDGDDIIG